MRFTNPIQNPIECAFVDVVKPIIYNREISKHTYRPGSSLYSEAAIDWLQVWRTIGTGDKLTSHLEKTT